MLSAENVSYDINGHLVFKDVSLSINRGDKIGLVGRNGAGKTTLLRLLSGEIVPTRGDITAGDYEVGMLPQDLSDWLDRTVYDFVGDVTGVSAAKSKFEESCKRLGKDSSDKTLMIYSDALDSYSRYDVENFDGVLNRALSQAGLVDIDVDERLERFSGGQRTRISLAALFASKYDVLLLDEPTNNLDDKGMVLLENFIQGSKAAFLMVSHDRRFLRAATNRVVELIGGEDGVVQYGMGYDEYVASRAVAQEATADRHEQYETERKRLRKVARGLSSRAVSASSRKTRNDNDKLNANFRKERAGTSLAGQSKAVQSRMAQLEEPDKPEEEISLDFTIGEKSRKRFSLLQASNLTAKYEGDDKVFGPISLHVHNGDKVAITGPNGSGKTTLLKVLAGQIPEYGGLYRPGREAKIIYIDQQQTVPIGEKSAVENLRHLAPGMELHDAIILLLKFNLKKEVINTVPAESLSGGERAKILLAAIVANQANLLIMDEPTNNLDITTIEALEAALKTYKGSVIITSHDKEFLDNLDINQKIALK
jgi:ATPase subunit of ABC transporter with duplicated ATPase domains